MAGKIAFIGGGNMASALIGGLVAKGWFPKDVFVVDPDPNQRERVAESFGVNTEASFGASLATVETVVWAVKPQVLRDAALSLGGLAQGALHVSIAAGIRLSDLTAWLGTQRVVRAMPNTAALVSAGVTGLLAGPKVGIKDREIVEKIVGSVGQAFWVDSDAAMDAVTAVSGSGPAYAFYFLEGFQEAARQLGFSALQSHQLVLQVVRGAVVQAEKSGDDFKVFRERVTSKGGTTEAAINVLDEHGTKAAIVNAVRAAYDRAALLGAELGGQAEK